MWLLTQKSPADSIGTTTVEDIWGMIEGFCGGRLNLQRDDPQTWKKRWPGGGPGLLGQALAPSAWLNRANPNLRSVFERVVGRHDLVTSVDHFGVLRPTRNVPMRRLPPQTPCRTDVTVHTEAGGGGGGGDATAEADVEPTAEATVVDMDKWKTKSKWLHWDLSPFHWVDHTMPPYTFVPHSGFISENNGTPLEPGARAKVQGLLNLIDARLEDGGFLCIPGFHSHLSEWAKLPENQAYKRDMSEAFDYLEVPKGDPMHDWAQPVPMRAGSLLVWNSELPHCNFPNNSDRFRMVQYVKCFPAPRAAVAEEAAEAVESAGLDVNRPRGDQDRQSAVSAWVTDSLGAERVADFTDNQRTILGLQHYD